MNNEVFENEAVTAAENWLALIDRGETEESWNQAAGLFKNAVTADQWKHALDAVQTPLGKVVTRTLDSKTYSTELPGAPDGEYVVIQYSTEFENKKNAVETVTPLKDKDGEWRVSGYFIK